MVFRFFDAASAGNEILVDSHTGGGGNAVTVTNGLFDVSLGGGTVADGSGAGTYLSLDQVFRDFGSVWLEINVGAETLAPRIQVQASAYALNASNLEGQPAANFVDVSSTGQTKSGRLTIADASGGPGNGLTVSSPASAAVSGTNTMGGALGYLGYGTTGVWGQGSYAGGFFQASNNSGSAAVGYGDVGIQANGNYAGAYVYDNSGDSAYLGYFGSGVSATGTYTGVYGNSGSTGVYGNGGSTGVEGSGANTGVYGTSANTGVYGHGASTGVHGDSDDIGVSGSGATSGGYFSCPSRLGYGYVGAYDYGVEAYGSWPNGAAGYFNDYRYTGQVWLGDGDTGVVAHGAYSAGEFSRTNHSVRAFLGGGDYLNNPVGVYGYSNASGEIPAYFRDNWNGTYAWVGEGGFKILGNGSVSFVQNHPYDASKVIVYAAPEGDEVAVYTRGTARLTNGEARVRLGDTFAWVANPDIGLTAHLTARGSPVPLAVESLTTGELVVRGPAGAGDVAFDYLVYGLRIGFEERAVVQAKREEAYIPSRDIDDAQYEAHAELKPYNALSRFSKMRDDVTAAAGAPAAAPDLSASKALENAIHVYDRSVDGNKGVGPESASRPEPPRPPVAGLVVKPGSAAATASPALGSRSLPMEVPAASAPEPRQSAIAADVRPMFPPNTAIAAVAQIVDAGDVLSNDSSHPGDLLRASMAADPGVVGIAAGEMGSAWSATVPVALPGTIVLCNVDAQYGAIEANDLLVASPSSGRAMRAGENPRPGTIVAKALEAWPSGTGTIRVLVLAH
jgi:hypothetical protein